METPQDHQGIKYQIYFETWDIKHIYKKDNKTVNWIADVGHLVSNSMGINVCNSLILISILDS